MKRNKKKPCTVLPVILSIGMCATTVGAVATAPTPAYAAVAAVLPSSAGSNENPLPPVREKLTYPEAQQLAGCEVYIDKTKGEVVIRPKNPAKEGIISSQNFKMDDFKAIIKELTQHGYPQSNIKRTWPVRFDGRIYMYMSVKGDQDYQGAPVMPLFFDIATDTINVGDNVSIKFIKDLTSFFEQNGNSGEIGLHHINGIESWDTAHVISMERMFCYARILEGKLDLSKWDVSKNWNYNSMFTYAGNKNDSFVLDFSNKQFKNQAHIKNMFNSFHGVLIANNWTLEDPNSATNPIQSLLDGQNYILTHYIEAERKYVPTSAHLLITDNKTILEKNKTAKYKFYKKVKVIYKTKDKERSVELELPAVYDSRIDDNGKLDASKPACSDPMKVVKPQIDEAIINAVNEMRTKNPDLNLPENVIPVPVREVKDTDSPTALFQTYYLATVTEEVTKAKTTYTADPSLKYQEVVTDTKAVDGIKQTITGAMKNGAWDPDATSEKAITKAVDGKARVGNKKVEGEKIQPGVIYQADSSLDYKKEQTTEGTEGTKTTTTIYKVDENKGLTEEVDGTPKIETKAAKNKVIKVGNKEVKTEEIQPGVIYQADSSLAYNTTNEIAGIKGTKTTTTIYKVDENTGLTDTVQSSESKTTTAAIDKVIKVGNVKTETEVIKCKTIYIADDTLAYEAKEDKTAGKDGFKTVTTTYKVNKTTGLSADVEDTQEKKVDPTDHVVRVGNKQVTHEGNKTITTTYDVDPNTGKLTNPKKHTSMPIGNLTPAVQLQQTVTFKDGNKQVASVKVEKGKAIATDGLTEQSMPDNPTKDGFTFKEWNTQSDGKGTTFTGKTTVDKDVTVYAIYTQNPVTPPQPTPPTPQPQPPVPNPNPSEEGGSGSAGAFGYQAENELTAMYRLYNPYSHEHLFTTDVIEKDNLVTLGWRFEGAVGKVYMHGEKGGVYRLYNPNSGEHHYTMKEDEVAKCVKAGWRNEGVKFFSVLDADKQTVGMVSMYNPYEKKFYHHYTSDADEIAKMVKAGWIKEEIKWYAAK